jgi:hypothetical protein
MVRRVLLLAVMHQNRSYITGEHQWVLVCGDVTVRM